MVELKSNDKEPVRIWFVDGKLQIEAPMGMNGFRLSRILKKNKKQIDKLKKEACYKQQ